MRCAPFTEAQEIDYLDAGKLLYFQTSEKKSLIGSVEISWFRASCVIFQYT